MRAIDADEFFRNYPELAIEPYINAPTVEPEITEKQAITKIINSGWLVNHDKELRDKWERPKGKWHHSGECSVCHKRSYKTTPLGDIIGLDFTDFCKNCGAKMRKGGTI